MKTGNRRQFISQSVMGLGATMFLSKIPAHLVNEISSNFKMHPIGFQVFPIRTMLANDFAGTLKMMAGLGYQTVEMCSPPGFVDAGFSQLVSMKASEMKRIISDSGLSCPSCHFTFGELKDKLSDRIEFAQQLGLSNMVCSSFWLPDTATIKDYLDAADTLNSIAENISKAGMQTGYHNHEMEFAKRDGVLIYDAMMGELNPKLVKMQFQTEVINLGYKASTYFTKYPGRFISSHLSDWTADKKQVPIGQGIIDWKEFFTAAQTGGVKNFFVEMDLATYKDSITFINGLLESDKKM
jgi:sugar phosphate isomerase/epimerase